VYFFFSSRRRHTRFSRDWSSDVCSSDLSDGARYAAVEAKGIEGTTKEKDVREVAQWMAEVDSALADDGDDNDPDLARYVTQLARSEERRVGKEGRRRGGWWPY